MIIYVGVEVRGGGEPGKWWVFSRVEVDTARRSHPKAHLNTRYHK